MSGSAFRHQPEGSQTGIERKVRVKETSVDRRRSHSVASRAMGKYDGWDHYFSQLEGDEHSLDFAQLEALINGTLPPSAHRYAVWWVGPHYYAKWRNYGWFAHPDIGQRVVRFDRKAGRRGRPTGSPDPTSPDPAKRTMGIG